MAKICHAHCPDGGGPFLALLAAGAGALVLAVVAVLAFMADYGALVMACAWSLLAVAIVAGVVVVRRLTRLVPSGEPVTVRRSLPAGQQRRELAARPVRAIEGTVIRPAAAHALHRATAPDEAGPLNRPARSRETPD